MQYGGMLKPFRRTWPRSYLELIDLENSIPLKQCSRCKQEFPVTTEHFIIHKGKPYCHCHACRKLDKKESHIRNKDHNNARSKKWADAHRERVRANDLEYAASHREEAKARAAKWYKDNHEYALERDRKRRRNNPEFFSLKAKEYQKTHPVIANLGKRMHKARKRAGGRHTRAELMELYDLQDGRCGYCGIPVFWNIKGSVHIDHVQPVSRGGSNIIDNLCLSCHDCNKEKYNKTIAEWMQSRCW